MQHMFPQPSRCRPRVQQSPPGRADAPAFRNESPHLRIQTQCFDLRVNTLSLPGVDLAICLRSADRCANQCALETGLLARLRNKGRTGRRRRCCARSSRRLRRQCRLATLPVPPRLVCKPSKHGRPAIGQAFLRISRPALVPVSRPTRPPPKFPPLFPPPVDVSFCPSRKLLSDCLTPIMKSLSLRSTVAARRQVGRTSL